jgi:hypothetical protein
MHGQNYLSQSRRMDRTAAVTICNARVLLRQRSRTASAAVEPIIGVGRSSLMVSYFDVGLLQHASIVSTAGAGSWADRGTNNNVS